MKRIFLFVTLMAITALAQAGVFKCETPTGLIYSEQPCPKNTKAQDFHAIKPTETETSTPSNNLMQQMEQENRARKKNNEAMQENAAKNYAEERKAICAEARRRLGIYQQQVPVYKKDENGERVYVDDDTRATIIENAKKAAATNCDS